MEGGEEVGVDGGDRLLKWRPWDGGRCCVKSQRVSLGRTLPESLFTTPGDSICFDFCPTEQEHRRGSIFYCFVFLMRM
jgi:hypothetical protein